MFVTNYRRGVFDDAMLKRCEEIMREVCAGFETELREFNGEADHVHLLVHYPPKAALSKLTNSLKGVSSRYLRAEYTGHMNKIGMARPSGPARTSQAPATEHHPPRSTSTSRTSSVLSDRHDEGAEHSGAAHLRAKDAFPSPAEAGDTHARSGMASVQPRSTGLIPE